MSLSFAFGTTGLGASAPASEPASRSTDPATQARVYLRRAKGAADEISFPASYPLDASKAYRVIAEVQLKMGDAERARATLREARRIVDDYHDAWAQPQEFECVARAQARAGDVAGAKLTLLDACGAVSKIPTAYSRWFWYAWIAAAQVRIGDGDRAATSWKNAERAVDEEGESSHAFDYAYIASGMVTAGRAQEVPRLLRKMSEDRVGASMAYRRVAEAQAQAGDILGARQTLRLVPEPKEAEDTLVEVAAAQARAGDIKGATATVRSFAKDSYNRDWALDSIASIQADNGDLPGAIATAKVIEDPRRLAEAREHIAARQVKVHDPAAQATIAAMVKSVPAMDEPRDQGETLYAAASLQRELGDRDGARNSLKQARLAADKIVTSDRQWNGKWELLGGIATERAALGDFAEAKATVDALPTDYVGDDERALPCRSIAAAQVLAGDLPGAEQWVKSIKSDYARACAWAGIAAAVSGHAESP